MATNIFCNIFYISPIFKNWTLLLNFAMNRSQPFLVSSKVGKYSYMCLVYSYIVHIRIFEDLVIKCNDNWIEYLISNRIQAEVETKNGSIW